MNKKILIVGLGRSGLFAALLAIKKSFHLSVYDDCLNEESELSSLLQGQCHLYRLSQDSIFFDCVVLSPGVPLNHPICVKARQKGWLLLSEIAFSLQYVPFDRRCIGVTGTNGKTTVSSCLARSLNASCVPTFLVGNSGVPLSYILYKGFDYQALVIELSSYQLELPLNHTFSCGILVSLGLDHLDRHQNYQNYLACKKSLLFSSSSVFIHVDCCLEDPSLWTEFSLKTSFYSSSYFPNSFAYLSSKSGIVLTDNKKKRGLKFSKFVQKFQNFLSDVFLEHDRSSFFLVFCFLVKEGLWSSFQGDWNNCFKKDSYRCQRIDLPQTLCRSVINDSKATNCHATLSALRSYSAPIVLILGGQMKGDWDKYRFELTSQIYARCRFVYLYGASASFFASWFLSQKISFYQCETLYQVSAHYYDNAHENDLVLFSPACSSYDQFQNYLKRGASFSRFFCYNLEKDFNNIL